MHSLFLTVVGFLVISSSVTFADQATVDYLVENLDISWRVEDNYPEDGDGPLMNIKFTNVGQSDFEQKNWKIYFPCIRSIYKARQNGSEFGSGLGLWIRHVNGDVYEIYPTSEFMGFTRNTPVSVGYRVSAWMASRTDSMPNWFVTSDESSPGILKATEGEGLTYVEEYTTERQWKRYESDHYDPYTPEQRLTWSTARDVGSALLPLIPQPVEINLLGEELSVNSSWTIVRGDISLQFEAGLLADHLQIQRIVDPGSKPANSFILLEVGTVKDSGDDEINKDEAYSLVLDDKGPIVTVTGSDHAGVFYGVQSLISLLDSSSSLPSGHIIDYPRFAYRGMHMDVARNFHSKKDVLRHLEAISRYKMNQFHFHITDDEGWRLEVPDLPELTQVGGHRCHNPIGDQCITPQLGAGPNLPNLGSGFFTVADYKEILQFAESRHITVTPEFDMPGHCHAGINAMLARYRKYKDNNITQAEEFLLSDLEDTSMYYSIQEYTDNAVNPCIESTYHFINHLIGELVKMHQDIQPLTTYNFGGDEVPGEAWVGSPKCQQLMAQEDYSTNAELKRYFVERVGGIVKGHGLDLAGWEDGFMDGNTPFPRESFENTNVYGFFWDNVWEWGVGHRAYVMANAGYKGVLSHATHLYFDFPHEPDPEERGYYWATRTTDARKAFGFSPLNIYMNMDILDIDGDPIDKEYICNSFGCPPLEPGKEDNIIGIQGQIWSETVRTSEQLDYMVFPRMLSVAERAWHEGGWEREEDQQTRETLRLQDWNKFANTLGHKELARLEYLKIAYHLPPPGAKYEGDNLECDSNYPGLPIQYSIDGLDWTDYTGPITGLSGTVHLRTRSFDGNRGSRVVRVSIPETATGTTLNTSYASRFLLMLSCLVCKMYI